MLNIGTLEYGIIKLKKVREMNRNTSEPYKYDLMILKEQDILNRLTGNAAPDELIRSMLHESLSW